MKRAWLAMTSATALGLATAVAGAAPLAPVKVGNDGMLIQVQNDRGPGGNMGGGDNSGGGSGARGGGPGGGAGLSNGAGQGGGPSGQAAGRSGGESRGAVQQDGQRRGQRVDGGNRARVDGRSGDGRRSGDARQFSRGNDGERRMNRREGGDRRYSNHRPVRHGWSRDRRHAFYGAVLIGVPFGYAAYASHPCYDWVVGPQGAGYYWNYSRCPV